MTNIQLQNSVAVMPNYNLSEAKQLTEQVEAIRKEASHKLEKLDNNRRMELGQYLTPATVARFMASMVGCDTPIVSILDAGAGVGSLLSACIEKLCCRPDPPLMIDITAYEVDPLLITYLRETLLLCENLCKKVGVTFQWKIIEEDFIIHAVSQLNESTGQQNQVYTCAILNPPYKEIQASSPPRNLLRKEGIETTNLYAGFVALAIKLLAKDGELVAITPRSFCNGPFFYQFRKFLLENTALRRIHLFGSRQEIFRDSKVLQENIILCVSKSSYQPSEVLISAGNTVEQNLPVARPVLFDRIIHSSDSLKFIHLIQDKNDELISARVKSLPASLNDLSLSVSTGKVVDFRVANALRSMPEDNTAPLIYPTHLVKGQIDWPKKDSKKPNAIICSEQTRKLLVPNEAYVLVKRFSSKEERRRLVATAYDGEQLPGTMIGFENHLNYFHQEGRGLDISLARGLATFLNSTLIDLYFRQFNGHTQVNATDLRNLRYPSREQLITIGSQIGGVQLSQNDIDELIDQKIFE